MKCEFKSGLDGPDYHMEVRTHEGIFVDLIKITRRREHSLDCHAVHQQSKNTYTHYFVQAEDKQEHDSCEPPKVTRREGIKITPMANSLHTFHLFL